MKKKILLTSLLLTDYLNANQIYISENFRTHNCTNIDYVYIKDHQKSKEELFEILKDQAKALGGNSVIQAEYSSQLFDTQHIACGIAANCDINKSPSFFLKSNNISQRTINLFSQLALGSESVEMSKSNTKETISSPSIDGKFGILENNFRVYGDFKVGVGLNLLASADYIYHLNKNISLFGGGSFGSSQYQLKTSNDYIYSLVEGLQIGVKYNDFELTFQKLSGISKTDINGVSYKPTDITTISLGYNF